MKRRERHELNNACKSVVHRWSLSAVGPSSTMPCIFQQCDGYGASIIQQLSSRKRMSLQNGVQMLTNDYFIHNSLVVFHNLFCFISGCSTWHSHGCFSSSEDRKYTHIVTSAELLLLVRIQISHLLLQPKKCTTFSSVIRKAPNIAPAQKSKAMKSRFSFCFSREMNSLDVAKQIILINASMQCRMGRDARKATARLSSEYTVLCREMRFREIRMLSAAYGGDLP